MATGSARGNSHRCGTIEEEAVVAVCKAPQDVSSDAPNQNKMSCRERGRGLLHVDGLNSCKA
jgi:hypothetical protein